jgi:hypothetical protein
LKTRSPARRNTRAVSAEVITVSGDDDEDKDDDDNHREKTDFPPSVPADKSTLRLNQLLYSRDKDSYAFSAG